MKILRATHLGMCFGVRDAIALATRHAANKPLTILGDLVHNETVLSQLLSQGVKIERQVVGISTNTVMITAHGASERTLNHLRTKGRQVLEATCPLVHFAHRSLVALVRDGCHPVIIGLREHVEVRGMTEDLCDFDVVLTQEDVLKLAARPRFGVVAQTTQPIEKVHRLVNLLRERFPQSEIR
ncbi:MAG: 4-hydroxy-3-methylbut-2-enyl diphosphate reductase, partial [Verrucomicrobia bacterium]|nr:4-hydroxy-3-methylbut-2-enyl diphosphate reductase [Verrucomicrobiota bacterium]